MKDNSEILRKALNKAMMNVPDASKIPPIKSRASEEAIAYNDAITLEYLNANAGDIFPYAITADKKERTHTLGLIIIELIDGGMRTSMFGVKASIEDFLHAAVDLFISSTSTVLTKEEAYEALFSFIPRQMTADLIHNKEPLDDLIKKLTPYLMAMGTFHNVKDDDGK